jgi:hypothetical protein
METSTFYSKSILKPEKKRKEKFEPKVSNFFGYTQVELF